MDEAIARRGQEPDPTPKHYEAQLRVIGRYLDEQHPRDIFFFELDGAYIARVTAAGQGGLKQELDRVHPRRHRGDDRQGARAPARNRRPGRARLTRRYPVPMKALKTVAVALGITLGAILVIPLIVLAGLFVWLKLTEEDDEEALELDEDV